MTYSYHNLIFKVSGSVFKNRAMQTEVKQIEKENKLDTLEIEISNRDMLAPEQTKFHNLHPIILIELIRSTFGRYDMYSGGCLKFHAILKSIFPNALGYTDGNHIITRIGSEWIYYDIDGIYRGMLTDFIPLNYKEALDHFKTVLSKRDIEIIKGICQEQ